MASPSSPAAFRAAAAWEAFQTRVAPWLSLLAGVVSSLLWREGVDGVRATFVLMSLFATVTLLLLFPPWRAPAPGVRGGAPPRVRSWIHGAAWWATVSSAQNALWFVIPFYVLSTSWPSRNAPFTLLLVAFGVLSCFDTFVRDRVLLRPAAAAVFVLPALAASLQLFLPVLTGAPPRFTVLAAGGIAALGSASLLLPSGLSRRRVASTLLGVAVAGAVLARAALPLLAPAPLRLASGTFALGREGLEPVAPVALLPAGAATAYVFVAVEAPRGLRESVRLRVEDEAGSHDSRPLAIEGGRAGGYRLWAEAHPRRAGPVQASVVTEGGQLVGAVRAEVVEGEAVRSGP